MNRREWEASQLPCPEPFGWWFAGLIDGEGCFSISRTPWGFRCELIVKLRGDDRPMLVSIAAELGIGAIYSGKHSSEGNGKPWVRWQVVKKRELMHVVDVLDAFPLRSKKARDYAIWREAAIHWAISDTPVDWGPLEAARDALREVRRYPEIQASEAVPTHKERD